MNARQTWVLAAVALAALILGASLGPRTAAQKAEPPKAESTGEGRYRVVPADTVRGWFVVIDTQTGHCWTALASNPNFGWTDHGSPAEARK